MLDYIRNSAQSFGVKVAFGVIILVFVFWGVGNFNDRDYSNVVAVVNGEPIPAIEFEKAYRDTEDYILRNNPGITRQELAARHLGRQVLRELIEDTLVAQEARRAGIEVSPAEMRQAAAQEKAFQDEKGNFDPEAYKRALAARRVSTADFEKDLAARLLRQKMLGMISAGVWVDPEEALNLFNYLRERREIAYIFMPEDKYLEKAEVSEAEARSWYDGHKGEFAIPASVALEYILVKPEYLVDRASIGEEKARAWYEANKNRYEIPEEARVAHILIPVAENANEDEQKKAAERLAQAKEELAKGKAFAVVADEFNQEGAAAAGGELGFIRRGATVPAFEEVAFSLEPGNMGEARTPFGLHLILVEEKKPGGIKPFDEVANEVYAALAAEEGADKLNDTLDSLIEDNILQKPLADSAARFGLKSEKTGSLDKAGLVENIGVDPAGATALLSLGANMPLDVPLEARGGYLVARVLEAAAAGTKEFSLVREQIEKTLKAEKALALDMSAAATLLGKIKNDTPGQLEKDGLKTGVIVDRGGQVADFNADVDLNQAIFDADAGQWLSKPYAVSGPQGAGALLARVEKIMPPEAGEFGGMEKIMAEGARQARVEAIYNLFVQRLFDGAKVEITNQNLVDRVNM